MELVGLVLDVQTDRQNAIINNNISYKLWGTEKVIELKQGNANVGSTCNQSKMQGKLFITTIVKQKIYMCRY